MIKAKAAKLFKFKALYSKLNILSVLKDNQKYIFFNMIDRYKVENYML